MRHTSGPHRCSTSEHIPLYTNRPPSNAIVSYASGQTFPGVTDVRCHRLPCPLRGCSPLLSIPGSPVPSSTGGLSGSRLSQPSQRQDNRDSYGIVDRVQPLWTSWELHRHYCVRTSLRTVDWRKKCLTLGSKSQCDSCEKSWRML
jgi:hypothetical protein